MTTETALLGALTSCVPWDVLVVEGPVPLLLRGGRRPAFPKHLTGLNMVAVLRIKK